MLDRIQTLLEDASARLLQNQDNLQDLNQLLLEGNDVELPFFEALQFEARILIQLIVTLRASLEPYQVE